MNPHYLNEQEQAAIISFTSNKVMFNAVRKALEHTIHHQGNLVAGEINTDINWVFNLVSAAATDEQVGQLVRASTAGLGYLSKGFDRLLEFKLPEPRKVKVNRAE